MLSLAVIEELKTKGYSQSQIAAMYGVTRQAVSWHKQTYGGRPTEREAVLVHFTLEGIDGAGPGICVQAVKGPR